MVLMHYMNYESHGYVTCYMNIVHRTCKKVTWKTWVWSLFEHMEDGLSMFEDISRWISEYRFDIPYISETFWSML